MSPLPNAPDGPGGEGLPEGEARDGAGMGLGSGLGSGLGIGIRAETPGGRRILALDVGDKRIGLAITDALGVTAQPLFTIHRTSVRADLKSVARFLRQHRVAEVVVGLPLHADGRESAQAAKARAFAEALRQAHPGLAHHLLDERLTTRAAHALLDAGGRRAGATDRLDRRDRIDQVAATLLLAAFLERRDGPALLPDPEAAG